MPKFESCCLNNRYDDSWINAFPKHAEEYAEQIMWLAPNMEAGKVWKSIATRLRNHAIYPENWPTCNECKIEPMLEAAEKALVTV